MKWLSFQRSVYSGFTAWESQNGPPGARLPGFDSRLHSLARCVTPGKLINLSVYFMHKVREYLPGYSSQDAFSDPSSPYTKEVTCGPFLFPPTWTVFHSRAY